MSKVVAKHPLFRPSLGQSKQRTVENILSSRLYCNNLLVRRTKETLQMAAYIRTIKVTIPRPSSNTTGKCLIIKINKKKSKRNHPPTTTTPAILPQPSPNSILQTCLPEQQPECPCLQANGPKQAPAPTTPAAQGPAPAPQLRNQAVTPLPTPTTSPGIGQPQAINRAPAVTLPALTTIPAAQATTRVPANATPRATAAATRAPWS